MARPTAEIVVLERDHYVSFANCGLPYHIGGAIPDRDSLLLQTPESLAKSLALDVRTGQEVLRIDRDAKEVEVRDLAEERTYRESYDKLVLCLGAGFLWGNVPWVKDHFSVVTLGIVFISILPMLIEFLRHRRGPRPK